MWRGERGHFTGTEAAAWSVVFSANEMVLIAATVPATAKDPATAVKFVRLLISGEGKALLEATGQPPVAPPIFNGNVPAELK